MALGSDYRVLQVVDTSGGYPGTGDFEFSMGSRVRKVGNLWIWEPYGVAPYGYQPFDSLDGLDVCYLAENFDDPDAPTTGSWEIGVAPLDWNGTSEKFELVRSDVGAVILESTTGSAISFSSGTIRCYNIFPAHELGYLEPTDNLDEDPSPGTDLTMIQSTVTARANLELGDVAVADTGSGNGLNADTLDGYHGNQLWRRATAETITGNHTHTGDLSLSGDNDFTGLNRFSQGVFVVPAGADLWATT